MKLNKLLTTFSLLVLSVSCTPKKEIIWKIAENPILTEWANKVDPLKPWPEYPRPDMMRKEWINLNGLWQYSITPKDIKPEKWTGEILVPYPVESALSGVKKRVSENENLWYRTSFKIPSGWDKKHILLNFEASDWETTVWIDGKEAGKHLGGYDPFVFDISELMGDQKVHELLVCVWDPTDKGPQPRGKQVSNPGGIWYTPSTGIWQTVWLEPVNDSYISSFRIVTNVDDGTITFKTHVENPGNNDLLITVENEGNTISTVTGKSDQELIVKIEDPILWSPDDPFLYDVTIELKNGKKVIGMISSYAGIRKISLGKKEDGFTRILFNNDFVWQNGPLDQGFWPDGIYTPPTEDAMVYDLEMTKRMGFNMLRKHVKVENRRFYYWCDLLGLMVWQDMPSGDKYISGSMPDISKSKEATDQFEFELKRLIETKYNHPSIILWVPFNEGWGQFETERITRLITDYDPTRLVNSSSGWTDRGTGSVHDIHHYPDPAVSPPEENRAIVLGEFGGLGLPVQGHTWEKRNWGYRNMEDTLQLLSRYEIYYDQVHQFVKEKGLSATVYTQTTDVETETNGLLTYDRKIIKMGAENVFKANANIIAPVLVSPAQIFTDSFTVELANTRQGGEIFFTLDGSEPDETSKIFSEPITLTESGTIMAFTSWDDGKSRTVTYLIEKKDVLPAAGNIRVKPGLIASVFDGRFSNLPDFSTLKPVRIRTVLNVSHSAAGKDSFFALVFEGYIAIPSAGVYGLFVNSDDGSKLLIDDSEPVINDGVHGMREEGKYFPLAKGYHKLRIEYFQGEGGVGLEFNIEAPEQSKMVVPSNWLFN